MDNYIEYGVLTPDHTNLPKVRGSGILERVGWLANNIILNIWPLTPYYLSGLKDLEVWKGEAG